MIAHPTLRDTANLFAWYAIEWVILAVLYISYVSNVTAYMGFDPDVNSIKIYMSVCAALIIFLIIPKKNDTRSFFLNILLAVYIIPSTIVYSFSNRPTGDFFIVLYATALVIAASRINMNLVKIVYFNNKDFMRFCLISSAILLILMLKYEGIGQFNLNIAKVYEFRSESAADLPWIFGYLRSILSMTIIPIGIVLSISMRKYVITCAFIACTVVLFGFANHKGILFYPFLSAAIFVSLSRSMKISRVIQLLILALLMSGADLAMYMLSDRASPWGWVVDIIVRRGLFVPPLLDYNHLAFFGDNPKYYWSMSKISMGLVQSPYDVSAPYVIGREYFHSATAAANTGFIGNGYSQAGLLGVTIYGLCVGIVISLLNSFSRKLGAPFVISVTFSHVVMMFTGADLLTLLLTHGLLASFLFLMLLKPRSTNIARAKNNVLADGAVPA